MRKTKLSLLTLLKGAGVPTDKNAKSGANRSAVLLSLLSLPVLSPGNVCGGVHRDLGKKGVRLGLKKILLILKISRDSRDSRTKPLLARVSVSLLIFSQ